MVSAEGMNFKTLITSIYLLIILFVLDSLLGWAFSFTFYYLLLILWINIKVNSKLSYAFSILAIISDYIAHTYHHPRFEYHFISHINDGLIYIIMCIIIDRWKLYCLNETNKCIHDDLTGILNRRGFYIYLEIEKQRAIRNKTTLSIMCIDCDNFKSINDQFGHTEGDRVLKLIAQSLIKHTRITDVISRIGGDEFIIVFVDSLNTQSLIIENAQRLYSNLINDLNSDGFKITFSCGLGIFINLELDNDTIILNIDNLMYDSKRNGKNQITTKIF
jgi:diguanylate cyclase (GGDEF)-like protein